MAKIFERNPDTGEIRSREVQKLVTTTPAQKAISRSEILDEIWAAKKHTIDGKWYVLLSDVCDILGEDHARKA
jgi:GH43 family beta-xylosidase